MTCFKSIYEKLNCNYLLKSVKKLKCFFALSVKALPRATHSKTTTTKMDAKAFILMTEFLDENKDKMRTQDYMTMMAGLKSLHDKKLVIDETKTIQIHPQPPAIRPVQPRTRKCGLCGMTGHDRRGCRSSVPDTNGKMITLFHFTSREASTHIIREKALKTDLLGAIYFTAMDFETNIKEEIAFNNWEKREMSHLMECVFKVEVPVKDVVKFNFRNVFHTNCNWFDLSKHDWKAFEIVWNDGKCVEKKSLGFGEAQLVTLLE